MKKILVSLVLIFGLFAGSFASDSPKMYINIENPPILCNLTGKTVFDIEVRDGDKKLPLDDILISVTDACGNDASKYVDNVRLYIDYGNYTSPYGEHLIDKVYKPVKTNTMTFFEVKGKDTSNYEKYRLDVGFKKIDSNSSIFPLNIKIFQFDTGGMGYQGKDFFEFKGYSEITCGELTSIGFLNRYSGLSLSEEEWKQKKKVNLYKKIGKCVIDKNNIKDITNYFGDLSNLEELTIKNQNISELPDLSQDFRNFKKLYLSNNKIKKLYKGFENDIVIRTGLPYGLNTLYLDNNDIEKIPDVFKHIETLEDLNLQGNSKLGALNEHFSVKNNRIVKCQDNITLSGKRLCIDSTGDKIKIYIEEKSKKSPIVLSNSLKNRLDTLLQKFLEKLDRKYNLESKKILKLEIVVEKLKQLKTLKPRLSNIVDYLVEKLQDEIEIRTLFR